MQILVVAMLVIGCTLYAAWTLMPAGLRRSLAGRMLTLPLPHGLQARFSAAAKADSGCGCDGCDHAPAAGKPGQAKAPAVQTITFHPRIRH